MKIVLCCLLLLSGAICFCQTILIKKVNIVDVENGSILANRHVLVKDGIISQIDDGNKMLKIKADTVVDGEGRYLLPGLWDMHTHIWSDATTFPLLIANGVTGVRGMFETMYNVNNWRKNIAQGKIVGPQLFVAGPIVDGPKPVWPGSVAVSNEAGGRSAVDSLKNKLKVDFIKVYSLLSYQNYMAIADESKKQHIPFAGHVPNEVTVVEAAQAGQKSQEHLYGMIEAGSDSAAYWFAYQRGTIKDSAWKKRSVRREFLFRTFNENKLKLALQEIKKTNTFICPTLTVNRGIAYVNDTSLLNDPRLEYMGRFIKDFWDYRKDFRFNSWTPLDFEQSRMEYELKLKIIKWIQEAGIPVLAGTDFPNPHCYIGFGIHDELALMVKAGFTPASALQTATINPAKYFDITSTDGTVGVNKNANLLLLSKNPLENIAHTKAIEMVFVKGKPYTAVQLQQMMEGVKKMLAFNNPPLSPTGMHVDE
jgi:hypothetical protein